MVGQTQMSPSLYDFQSVMGELFVWNYTESGWAQANDVSSSVLGFPEEIFFHIYT